MKSKVQEIETHFLRAYPIMSNATFVKIAQGFILMVQCITRLYV
jgi:hypothetical protein